MDKDLVVRNELCFTNDHSAPFWDFVGNCRLEDCPVYDDCPHKKSRGVKCGLGVGYMKRIEDIVMKNVEVLSSGQLFRIGTGLVPLYRLYFKLKMKELEIDDPLRSDGSVEPIYEAIAKYAMRIEKMWRTTGLSDADLGKISEAGNDFNFYEQMENDDAS